MKTPASQFCSASCSMASKYTMKRVGVITQPCFTPVEMGKLLVALPSTTTGPVIPVCNDLMMLITFINDIFYKCIVLNVESIMFPSFWANKIISKLTENNKQF